MIALKDRIAEAMRRHPRLSQADIARACGVKTPSVAAWLNGDTKSLKPEPARRGAKLFGCDQNWLSTGVGSPNWSAGSSQDHPSAGAQSGVMQAHDLSHHLVPDRAPLLLWDKVVMGAKSNEQFRTILPDDALGKDFPAGTEVLWTSPAKRHPKVGRQALVIDDAGAPHARWLGQGSRPGEFTAVSHDPLYRSFDGVTQRFEVVAIFKAKVEPDDQ